MISDIDSIMKKLRGESGAILSSYCLPRFKSSSARETSIFVRGISDFRLLGGLFLSAP
jgi:hypothetical protein